MKSDGSKELFLYRTPQFERCLDELRKKGGNASDAVNGIEGFFRCLMQKGNGTQREQFRYTRNGEYRIRHCKKISLGCGYRLVFIQKDCCYVFLYAGSHDDCFRWIERNKGLTYELDWASNSTGTVQERYSEADALPDDLIEEREFVERYEQRLMAQLDDDLLARVFPGWSKSDKARPKEDRLTSKK